ncbi:MAG: caspase family protein [Pseudomonadota bacterium]
MPVAAVAATRAIIVTGRVNQPPEIFVQMGHTDDGYTSNTVAGFTPDGRYVLTGGKDGTVRLWETETGREIRTFRCRDRVTDIAVSADGRTMVSGGTFHGDNITAWELFSGAKIRAFSLEGLNGPPVVFRPGDNSLLAGGEDGLLRLWDLSSGALIREYAAAINGEVSALVLTPDGGSAIVAYRYYDQGGAGPVNTIGVWDIDTGKTVLSFNNTGTETVALAITPDGSQLLSSNWGQDSVRLWNVQTGAPIKSIVTGGTSAIAVSAGGRYALLGGYMNFRLVELATGKEIRKIEAGIGDWVQSIAFSPDGRYALVGDQVPQPKLWDLASGKRVRTFGGYAGQTITARIAQAGKVLVTAHGYSNSLALWDAQNGIQLRRIKNDPGSLSTSAAVSADGATVAFGGWDMTAENAVVSIWDAHTGKQITKIHPPEKSSLHVRAPVFTKGAGKIIWALGGEIIISGARDGVEIKRWRLGPSDIYQMAIDPAERYLLAYDDLRNSTLVDITTGETLKTFKSAKCIFSRDGQKIYSLAENSETTAVLKETDLSNLTEKRLFELGFNTRLPADGLYLVNYIESFLAGSNNTSLFFSDSLNHFIYKIDLRKGEITTRFTGHTEKITSIDTAPDGAFLCSGSQDGTTRFWDPDTGRELARFIGFSDEEWIVITPEGYFNASPSGAKYLNVRVGSQVYSIDNFYEKYYNPAYVAAVLQGKKVSPAADIRQGVALPPEVAIVSPATAAEFKNDEIQITVSAEDMGGGIDEIRLYHNGKAVGEDTRGIRIASAERRREKTYTVTLVDGVNRFRAVGFSRDRTESNPAEITVTLAAPIKKVSLYVLAVGINSYKNPALNLNYAEPDARGIADFFRQRGEELFKNAEINGVYNDQATKAGLVAGLKTLERSKPQDAVLIYLAGHGESIDEKWYFIPYDLTYPERADDVREKALSSDELSGLIQNITAQKVLVLIDACKSGAVLVAFRGFEDRKALSQLSRAAGVHVVAASSKEQFAAEVKELGHGVFTYTLLEGLNGKAVSKGDTITVRKLMGYVEEELPALTRKYRQEAQYPVVDSKGMDFPLVKSR